ncbi:Wzz/FepE/Etk N-terminal domain-containing protein [Flavobacteriaceae bacterium]|nr:Wzz/FepE/Etk N-terminal domain-containing protein [Flavobacteriaceae bacterium]
MQNNNQQNINEEDSIDIISLLFILLSNRFKIIISVIIFILIGFSYNYYQQETFKTYSTLFVSEDQSDASSFINNNEYQFLYNNNLDSEDHASLFKSTVVLKGVVEKLGLNYRFYKKNLLKANSLITKESLPFEILFKENFYNNKCIIKYDKDNVVIEINEKTFSFSKNENIFENSIFRYTSKFSNDISQNTYIIEQYKINESVSHLKSKYVINQPKNSNTYGISYSGPNKDLNSIILKGIVDGVIENNINEKKNVYKLSIDFIDKRIYKLEIKIDSLNSLISNFKISNGVYMPEAQTNSALTHISDIEKDLFNTSLQSELSYKLIDEVEKQSSFDLLPTDMGIDNRNINQMVSQFNKIILEKNNLLVDATEKNPLVIQSQEQLVVLRSNILNSLDIYIEKLEVKLNRYNDFKQQSNSIVKVIPEREAELKNLEKDLLIKNNLYSYLSQKKEEALISLSSLESNIKLINEVDYILESTTNKPQILAIFSFLGLALPVGFSLGMFFFRGFYVDIEYLKQNLNNINFLGMLKFSKGDLSIENKAIQNELFKRIYHNMFKINSKSTKGKSIMITSCVKNEGKTYTAFNFSRFLVSTDKKVLLIGADLGNPDLKNLFNKKNTRGLTDIISDNKNNFKELFEKYKFSENQLDTLFAGTKTSNKNSIFDNNKFDILLSFLYEKYDYIIFDTAPVMLMVDSLKLLPKLDYNIHVFRKNYSSKKFLNFVLDYKEKYKPKNMGYVFLDDTKADKFIDKYGYGSGYGYGYGVTSN